MTKRSLFRIGLIWIAGLLSFAVLGCGLYWSSRIDIRVNPVLSILFCALPIFCFAVFLAGFLFRNAAVLQPILAVAFVTVYAMLNWRTCSAPGYCGSVASIVFVTATTPVSMTLFAVAIASVAGLALDRRRQTHGDQRTVVPRTAFQRKENPARDFDERTLKK